jgi:TMEM175 potassium channel family protein
MEKNTSRLEAFSDGVFAIAITLLVLELKVPHLASGAPEPTAKALRDTLAEQWPGYVSFITSFFTILIMWVHHHTLFRLVCRTDARLLFANGLLLMMVTVVPFPTAVVAEYLQTAAASTAVESYCGTFVVISIAFYLLAMAAFRKEMLDPAASADTPRRLRRSYRWGPPLYSLAFAASFFSPWLAMSICTGLWVYWAATTRDECPPEV